MFTSCASTLSDNAANCELLHTLPLRRTPFPAPDPSRQHAATLGLDAEHVASNAAIDIPTSATREVAQCSAFRLHPQRTCHSPVLPIGHFSAQRMRRLGTIIEVPSPSLLLPALPLSSVPRTRT